MATSIRYQDSNLDTFVDVSIGAETLHVTLNHWDDESNDYETLVDSRYSGYSIDEAIETALHDSGIEPRPTLRRVS